MKKRKRVTRLLRRSDSAGQSQHRKPPSIRPDFQSTQAGSGFQQAERHALHDVSRVHPYQYATKVPVWYCQSPLAGKERLPVRNHADYRPVRTGGTTQRTSRPIILLRLCHCIKLLSANKSRAEKYPLPDQTPETYRLTAVFNRRNDATRFTPHRLPLSVPQLRRYEDRPSLARAGPVRPAAVNAACLEWR